MLIEPFPPESCKEGKKKTKKTYWGLSPLPMGFGLARFEDIPANFINIRAYFDVRA